jgi:hypothetical protein
MRIFSRAARKALRRATAAVTLSHVPVLWLYLSFSDLSSDPQCPDLSHESVKDQDPGKKSLAPIMKRR